MNISHRIAGERRREAGFTMIEIAMAVAVIAFAMVAIIGLLPLGIETQRDNRQDTIINHDGSYLMEAIRGGAPDVEDLMQFVELDSVTTNGIKVVIRNATDLVHALSSVNSTNKAIFRSITGAASLRSPAATNFAMRYLVDARILPVSVLTSVDSKTPYAGEMARNLYEVRLAMYWPVAPNGNLPEGVRRQVFRTVLGGSVDTNSGFFNPSVFVKP